MWLGEDTVLGRRPAHGYRKVASTTGEAFYLLPYGYDLQRLYQTAVSGAEFTAALRASTGPQAAGAAGLLPRGRVG